MSPPPLASIEWRGLTFAPFLNLALGDQRWWAWIDDRRLHASVELNHDDVSYSAEIGGNRSASLPLDADGWRSSVWTTPQAALDDALRSYVAGWKRTLANAESALARVASLIKPGEES